MKDSELKEKESIKEHSGETWYNYVNNLPNAGAFDLYGLEYCVDLLISNEFKNSGLSDFEFLLRKRNEIRDRHFKSLSPPPVPITSENELPY